MLENQTMAPENTHAVAPQADHADVTKTIVQRIAQLRAWVFLAALIVIFEIWAQTDFGGTFVGSPFNWQSVAVFAVAPLLLAIGQTFVIISGGIDLSAGFIMGLAAVVAAHATNYFGVFMPLPAAMVCGILVAILAATIPGIINGLLISRLNVPLLSARSACSALPEERLSFLPEEQRYPSKLLFRSAWEWTDRRYPLSRSGDRRFRVADALYSQPDAVWAA